MIVLAINSWSCLPLLPVKIGLGEYISYFHFHTFILSGVIYCLLSFSTPTLFSLPSLHILTHPKQLITNCLFSHFVQQTHTCMILVCNVQQSCLGSCKVEMLTGCVFVFRNVTDW